MPGRRGIQAMAEALRAALERRGIALPHADCLEIAVAQATGDGKAPCLTSAIPILRILSEEKAKDFYVGFLGFTVDWEHRFGEGFPLYAQVSRSGVRLHLSGHHGDASPGATVFVWMRGIEALHRELLERHDRYGRPGLEPAEWDARVMTVEDPFGNRLRFSEPNRPEDPRG